MAASMWRMNGLRRRMAELLVLSALLLSNEVMCQSEEDPAATVPAAAGPSATPNVPASGDPAAPAASVGPTQFSTPAVTSTSKTAVIEVIAVDIANDSPAKDASAEKTKSQISPSSTSPTSSSSAQPSRAVFGGILGTGLLSALLAVVGYFKFQRRSNTHGVKVAEEAYPVDQENQGNTLVSVAPLNPPPETQEKPSINGESTEPAKTEPPAPPTNGHSTTKTADTEL